jgi:hypothetical protein
MRICNRNDWMAAVVALALVFGAGGCDSETEYDNSCPRINHVGEAHWDGETLQLGVWLQDLEADPVDLLVTDGAGGLVEDVLGHGVIGLSSSKEYPGQPHVLSISAKSLEGSTTLTFVPVDFDGCEGEAAQLQVPAL